MIKFLGDLQQVGDIKLVSDLQQVGDIKLVSDLQQDVSEYYDVQKSPSYPFCNEKVSLYKDGWPLLRRQFSSIFKLHPIPEDHFTIIDNMKSIVTYILNCL
jgi:hypothetical protein